MSQIEINPTEITLEFVSGGSPPPDEQVAVTNSGFDTLNQAQVIGGKPNFVSALIGPGGPNNNQTIDFSINNTNQPVGLTVHVLTIFAIGSISPRFLTLNVNVLPSPIIETNPDVLNFGVAPPSASPEITLDITNGGGLTLDDVTVTALPAWLTADKIISGPANVQQIKFTADPSGLPDGFTEGTVTLEALNADPTTIDVSTSIFVSEAPTLQLSSMAESFLIVEGGPQPDPPLGGDMTVLAFAIGGAQLPGVTATPDQLWLAASVAGVGNEQIITLSLIEVIAFALPLGEHTANVAVTSEGIANSPQTIVVTLTVSGPFVQLDVSEIVLTPSADYASGEPDVVLAKIVGAPAPVTVTGGIFWLNVEVDSSDLDAQRILLSVIDRPRTREEFATTLLVSGSTPATLLVSMAESGLVSRPDCDIDFVERIDPNLLIKCDVPIVPPPILGPPEDTPSDGDDDCKEPLIEYDFGETECLYGTMWWTKGKTLGWCKPKLHLKITYHGCSGDSPGAGDYCGSSGEDDLVVTSITLDACGHVCAVACENDDDGGGT